MNQSSFTVIIHTLISVVESIVGAKEVISTSTIVDIITLITSNVN